MQAFKQINFICHQNSVFNRAQTEGQTVSNTQIDLDLLPICFCFASVLLLFCFRTSTSQIPKTSELRQIAISKNIQVGRGETKDRMEILRHAAKLIINEIQSFDKIRR